MSLHPSNPYHVEASVNAWFRAQVNAYTWPVQFSSTPAVAIDEPNDEPDLPRFSVHHIPINRRAHYQGNVVDGETRAVLAGTYLEINCWVSRENGNWRMQRDVMRGFVDQLITLTNHILVMDYSDPSDPQATDFAVTLGEVEPQETQPDPNESIRRARLLVRYDWRIHASLT